MRYFKCFCMFIIFALSLTGCVSGEKGITASNTEITIDPYDMSEKERSLVIKTGVEQIEYFNLNGNLKEDDDLQFSVEVYKNGKFKEELLNTSGEPKENFKNRIISFGVGGFEDKDHDLKILAGIPSALGTTSYTNNMTTSSFNRLVEEKVTLEKNKPIYLVAWSGTTKNSLSSIGSQNGEMPTGLDGAEISILYKVLWTNKEKK